MDQYSRFFQGGLTYESPNDLPNRERGSLACSLQLVRPLIPRPPAETLEAGECAVEVREGSSQIFFVSDPAHSTHPCRKFMLSCYRSQGSTRSITMGEFFEIMGHYADFALMPVAEVPPAPPAPPVVRPRRRR